jgi:hypothetical protein
LFHLRENFVSLKFVSAPYNWPGANLKGDSGGPKILRVFRVAANGEGGRSRSEGSRGDAAAAIPLRQPPSATATSPFALT